MNINEYIASGVLESYILGGLSKQESTEVESNAALYPEVRAELDKLETDLENIAMSYSKTPAPYLKLSIAAKFNFASTEKKEEAKIISIGVPAFYKQAIAASITLAVISTASAGYFWNQWKNAESKVVALEFDKTTLSNNINLTKQQLDGANNYLSLMQDTSSVLITLKGSALSPNSAAKVLWNKTTKEVYLGGLASLPAPSEEQQYQLWAIVDGQPVDAGVFDIEKGNILQQLKTISNAQAFAVTLEKKGGSPTPTLAALFLIGNV